MCSYSSTQIHQHTSHFIQSIQHTYQHLSIHTHTHEPIFFRREEVL